MAVHGRQQVLGRVRSRRVCGGFTLLETALATVILGVGVLALIEAQAAFTRHNDWSTSSATAAYLANEIRERVRGLPRHDPVGGLRVITAGNTSTLRGWGREPGENTVQQFNDLDDYDGVTFGNGGDQPGPIDARGQVIPEVGPDGQPLRDDDAAVVPMRGWSQSVTVEKVDPLNFAQGRAKAYFVAAVPPSFDGIAVDRFPLRVTVVVRYQPPGSTSAGEAAKVSWIVPP